MPSVFVKDNESFDVALRRFKRSCEKAGLISEMRRHEFYEKPKWAKKRQEAQAKKRLLKRLYKESPHSFKSAKKRTTRKVKDNS